jgi:hypothetical protein
MPLINDIIDRLPEAIQEMVWAHSVTIAKMEFEEKQEWIAQILGRHWNGAYQTLNDKLLPSERIIEQERLNRMVVAYNKENKAQADMWREFFLALIAIGMQRFEDEIVG